MGSARITPRCGGSTGLVSGHSIASPGCVLDPMTRSTSSETMSFAWFSKKVRQFWEGGFRRRTMYFETAPWLISMPSLSNSLCIRGAPQSGLARDICRIRSRISAAILGRPDPRPFHLQ